MKIVAPFQPVFNPAARTLNFASAPGFQFGRLLAVLNLSPASGALIYAVGSPALGISSLAGTMLTLDADTTAMSASDPLMVIYDDGNSLPALGAAAAGASLPVVLANEHLPSGSRVIRTADVHADTHLALILAELRVQSSLLSAIGTIADADVRALRDEAILSFSTSI